MRDGIYYELHYNASKGKSHYEYVHIIYHIQCNGRWNWIGIKNI